MPSSLACIKSDISIHALREESDKELLQLVIGHAIISIHALREESDDPVLPRACCLSRFQSTPSARRATVDRVPQCTLHTISIHALREESD